MIYSSKSSPFPGDLASNWTAEDCRRLVARTVSEVRDLTQQFAADLLAAGFARPESYGLRVAFEEALLNGIKHGNGNDPSKQVRVQYRITADQVLLMIEDEGQGFKPDDLPDPRVDLEQLQGRGILLMRSYMTWVRFNARGNGVTMCKRKCG
jgi:serine/threonine-protein kinase RsbW